MCLRPCVPRAWFQVTANKAFIAEYLPELQAALKAKPKVKFAYEAAVCGGIPIIHSLQSDFFSDDVTKVMGIMNGTTNFMLCKMEDEGADYGRRAMLHHAWPRVCTRACPACTATE